MAKRVAREIPQATARRLSRAKDQERRRWSLFKPKEGAFLLETKETTRVSAERQSSVVLLIVFLEGTHTGKAFWLFESRKSVLHSS